MDGACGRSDPRKHQFRGTFGRSELMNCSDFRPALGKTPVGFGAAGSQGKMGVVKGRLCLASVMEKLPRYLTCSATCYTKSDAVQPTHRSYTQLAGPACVKIFVNEASLPGQPRLSREWKRVPRERSPPPLLGRAVATIGDGGGGRNAI